jgi:hypothetical protein
MLDIIACGLFLFEGGTSVFDNLHYYLRMKLSDLLKINGFTETLMVFQQLLMLFYLLFNEKGILSHLKTVVTHGDTRFKYVAILGIFIQVNKR